MSKFQFKELAGTAGLIVLAVLGIVAMVLALGLLFALPVMWLWNGVLVYAVTFANPISIWQAWGLMILSGFLVKSSTYRPPSKSN